MPTARRTRWQIFHSQSLIAACIGIVLVPSGCSRRSRSTIAVIPDTTAQELWESEHAGAAAAVLGTRWQVYWNGPTREDDVERQISLVEKAANDGVGGLVLSPIHSIALTTAVRGALARGIPTVIVGSVLPISPSDGLVYIVNDDLAAGREAAERVGAVLGGKGEVALLGFNPDISSMNERAAAFQEELARLFPNIRLIARRPGSFRLGQAEQEAEEVLQSNQQLNAIVTIGITSTRGAYIALKTTNRIRDVKLIGCDQDLDLMSYLRKGEIDSIVAQNTYEMGYLAVQAIETRRISGIIRLRPVLVTKQNIDQPRIQQMLTMDWRPGE